MQKKQNKNIMNYIIESTSSGSSKETIFLRNGFAYGGKNERKISFFGSIKSIFSKSNKEINNSATLQIAIKNNYVIRENHFDSSSESQFVDQSSQSHCFEPSSETHCFEPSSETHCFQANQMVQSNEETISERYNCVDLHLNKNQSNTGLKNKNLNPGQYKLKFIKNAWDHENNGFSNQCTQTSDSDKYILTLKADFGIQTEIPTRYKIDARHKCILTCNRRLMKSNFKLKLKLQSKKNKIKHDNSAKRKINEPHKIMGTDLICNNKIDSNNSSEIWNKLRSRDKSYSKNIKPSHFKMKLYDNTSDLSRTSSSANHLMSERPNTPGLSNNSGRCLGKTIKKHKSTGYIKIKQILTKSNKQVFHSMEETTIDSSKNRRLPSTTEPIKMYNKLIKEIKFNSSLSEDQNYNRSQVTNEPEISNGNKNMFLEATHDGNDLKSQKKPLIKRQNSYKYETNLKKKFSNKKCLLKRIPSIQSSLDSLSTISNVNTSEKQTDLSRKNVFSKFTWGITDGIHLGEGQKINTEHSFTTAGTSEFNNSLKAYITKKLFKLENNYRNDKIKEKQNHFIQPEKDLIQNNLDNPQRKKRHIYTQSKKYSENNKTCAAIEETNSNKGDLKVKNSVERLNPNFNNNGDFHNLCNNRLLLSEPKQYTCRKTKTLNRHTIKTAEKMENKTVNRDNIKPVVSKEYYGVCIPEKLNKTKYLVNTDTSEKLAKTEISYNMNSSSDRTVCKKDILKEESQFISSDMVKDVSKNNSEEHTSDGINSNFSQFPHKKLKKNQFPMSYNKQKRFNSNDIDYIKSYLKKYLDDNNYDSDKFLFDNCSQETNETENVSSLFSKSVGVHGAFTGNVSSIKKRFFTTQMVNSNIT